LPIKEHRRKRMKHTNGIWLGIVVILAFLLTMSVGCAKEESKEEIMPESKEQETKAEKELPAAVVEAIKANVPDAEIDFVEVAKEAGITLYDIEFKANRGEIEVAEDGTVLDVVTVITMGDLPGAAAEAIQKAVEGATIKRLEKSEIRSEIKKEGEVGELVILDTPRYVYEAELIKDGQTGEVEVDAEGNIIEPLKWDTKGS
jgi:uncharacterized membrane protein YkoI